MNQKMLQSQSVKRHGTIVKNGLEVLRLYIKMMRNKRF